MILGMSIAAFTLWHVIVTLIAIGSELIAVGGMFASHRLPGTTALFLLVAANSEASEHSHIKTFVD